MKKLSNIKHNEDYFINLALNAKKKNNLIIVCPYESYFIKAINKCMNYDLLNATLVGDQNKIKKILKKEKINDKQKWKIVHASDDKTAANKAMQITNEQKDSILMKGIIDTSIFLKALLNKEYNLRDDKKLLSHCCLSCNPNYNNFYIISDPAIIIKPTFEQKIAIIENAVSLANSLGIKKPYVANLTAKEKVYDKMPTTIEADKLQKYFKKKSKKFIVSGPIQIDLAIDYKSSLVKKNNDKVAGKANILVCPDIEAANILSKALVYLGNWSFAGIVLGAKIPIVLNSRSTNEKDLVIAICLSCIYKNHN